MTATRFSVAMCTFNGEQYLRQQLDSIARQTRPPDELVVCDDGSTDATCRIVTEWASTAPCATRLYSNELPLGIAKNFERAIGFCTGALIALSDQDDVWLPEKIAFLEDTFESNPDVGLVFTDAEIVDEETQSTGTTLWNTLPLAPDERRRSRAGDAVDTLLQGSTATGATMAFRARFKDLVLPIPAERTIAHDAWIALLIAAVSDVLPVATPTIKYRRHAGQQIGAVPRMRPAGGIGEALQRPTIDEAAFVMAMHAHQRLMQQQSEHPSDSVTTRLAARLAHLQMRAATPTRLTTIVKELWAGRYRRYSRGLLSAAKDLLRS